MALVAELRSRDVAAVAVAERRPRACHRDPETLPQQERVDLPTDRERNDRFAGSAAAVLDLQLVRAGPDRLGLPPDRGWGPVTGVEAHEGWRRSDDQAN